MANMPILCPRCRHLIGSNETVCSQCGASRANPLWKTIAWIRGSLGDDWVVQFIIIVNIVFYIFSLILTEHHSLNFNAFSFLSPGQSSLFLLGATGTIPINEYGRFWSLLSANYLHGGLLHIVFNLIALHRMAPLVSQEYGSSRMFIIYTFGGIGGFMLSYLVGIPLTIGASAAICALLGSLLYYGKNRGGAHGSIVFREVGGWVVSLFVFGFIVPGINNWGHGGGVISGLLLGMLLGYNEKKRETTFHHILAIACGLATIGCLVWAGAGAALFRLSQ
jgi:rhomboid protease GluP